VTAADAQTARRGTVLVVDDEEGVRASVRAILEETCDVLEAGNGAEALEILKAHEVDLVMLDQRMPGEPGIDVLPRIKAADPSAVVVIATAVRELRTAVEALKRGAYDYLTKPFDVDDILMLAQRALEKRALEREVLYLRTALAGGPADANTLAGSFERMVGRHPEMARIYQLITQIASTPTTVLITGESGTGKELVARAIHARSDRRAQPFVAVNVAAIPDTLVESELFGHEKGAFTGAHAKKLGRFEVAHGGTVFLDEIGTLRMDLQAKLLRVLQEREIERLGGIRPVPVDVRILAATNVNLRTAVKARTFREDLYYRLNVVHIEMPSLNRRREDIPLLVAHFLAQIARESGVRKIYAPEAVELLATADWPGNIRQLQNVVRQNVALSQTPIIPVELVQQSLGGSPGRLPSFDEARDEFTRSYLSQILQITGGNVSQAARLARRNRTDFYKLLARHQLTPEEFKQR